MTKKFKILAVDDEADILDLLQYNLEKVELQVKIAFDGMQAIEIAESFLPDIILLDIMLPILDGVETCRKIRAIPQLKDVFIIFLTSRNEEYSEVAAFEAGANDYIIKPIKPRALISRILAHLHRDIIVVKKDQVVNIGNLIIDKTSHTVLRGTDKIILAKKEFELLFFLSSNPNKIFNREDLLKRVWGTNVFVVSRTVDVHIRKIREKLGNEYIHTVKGIGYKFETE